MTLSIGLFFISVCFFSAGDAFAAFTNGEIVIVGHVYIYSKTNKIEISNRVKMFDFLDNDNRSRSNRPTDWQIVLKDKNLKSLDSFYLKLEEIKKPIICHEGEPPLEKPVVKFEPYEGAEFNFQYSKKTYQIELFFKGELKTKVLVMHPENNSFVMSVNGLASMNYADPKLFVEKIMIELKYAEKLESNGEYRLVTLDSFGKVLGERFFDFVETQLPPVCPYPATSKTICKVPPPDKRFHINMQYFYEIAKIQLYKGEKLLAESIADD